MELAECLALEGFKITFVHTEFVHKRVLDAMADASSDIEERINLVSISDGLELCEDRSDLGMLTETMAKAMPGNLEDLIKRINMTNTNKITCLLADFNLGWALVVAAKLGIRRVAVWPASAALLTLICSAQELIENGVINQHGTLFGTFIPSDKLLSNFCIGRQNHDLEILTCLLAANIDCTKAHFMDFHLQDLCT